MYYIYNINYFLFNCLLSILCIMKRIIAAFKSFKELFRNVLYLNKVVVLKLLIKFLSVAAFLFLFQLTILAQPTKDGSPTFNASGDTVIPNRYSALVATALPNDLYVTVNDINELSGNFSFTKSINAFATANLTPGDALLIIQMQGASIDVSNTVSFGTILDYNGAGNYELNVVASISGNIITLCSPVRNTYRVGAANSNLRAQVVRVPRFINANISPLTTLSGKPWNGTTGGIISMELTGDLNINNGSINATGIGFRGGNDVILSGFFNINDFAFNDVDLGAQKGEGIAGNIDDYITAGYSRGKGAPANGGGGGNGHNCGGGGGSNAGINYNMNTYNGTGIKPLTVAAWANAWDLESAGFSANVSPGGGRGGYSYAESNQDALTMGPNNVMWAGDGRRNNGGLGGRPLDYTGNNKLFMGGGGGSGESNNGSSGFGGAGGGIVCILSNGNILGNGTALIQANGIDGTSTSANHIDAAGGGGGGGAILIQCLNNITGVQVNANGGNGGSQIYEPTNPSRFIEAEGPGGGGSGGYIFTTPTTVNRNALGGLYGATNADLMTEFIPNGATSGAEGTRAAGNVIPSLQVCDILNISDIVLSAKMYNENALLNWNATYAPGDVLQFHVERSTNGVDFTKLGVVTTTNQGEQFNFTDNFANAIYLPKFYYRIKAITGNGSIAYSNVVSLIGDLSTITGTNNIYPNPASVNNNIWVKTYLQQAELVGVSIIDVTGKTVCISTQSVGAGLQFIAIHKLWQATAKGLYFVKIQTATSNHVHRLIVQ